MDWERLKKLITIISMVLIFIATGLFGSTAIRSMAREDRADLPDRYYKSVLIKEGDSLWSISDEFRAGSGLSQSEYTDLLRRMNKLTQDTIHAGQYLTVVYYKNIKINGQN